MQERISQLQHCENFKEGLRATCRTNKISITLLNGLTIKRLRTIHIRTLQHYQSNPDKARNSWFENQLRLFHWALLIEAFFTEQLLTQFNNTHWSRLQTYFPLKNSIMFEYEAKKLLGSNSPSHSRVWVEEECQLLTKIMEDKSLINRWNEVARRFYEESGKLFYRSSKQCRQQWFNHLDISKIHGDWTEQEDKTILEFVLSHGRKWALICKQSLPHRTQHMIKNRFKSLLSKTISPFKKENQSERKIIKHILGSLNKREIQMARDQQDNGNEKEFIKKQLTFSSEKELKSQEEGCQELQDSLLVDSERQMPQNGREHSFINQSIIHSDHSQQNKQSEENIPRRPIFHTQPHLSLTNSNLIQPQISSPHFLPQQISAPSPNNITFFPFFPTFYTLLTPTLYTLESSSQPYFQEQ